MRKNDNIYILVVTDDDGSISMPMELTVGADGVNIPPYVVSAFAVKAKDGIIRIPLSEVGEIKTAELNEDAMIKRRLDGYRPFFASTSTEVARFFLSKDRLDHRKLNYLVYLAFVEYLMVHNHSKDNIKKLLFSRSISVEGYGPNCLRQLSVSKDIHGNYRQLDPNHADDGLDSDIINILNRVWHRYQNASADKLEKLIAGTYAMTFAWFSQGELDINTMNPNDIYQCYEEDKR